MSPIKVTDATFERDVLGAPIPVLVDFWATWCAPCRAVAPVLDELSTELEGTVTIAKVDVDECPVTATRLRIQSIPTFILFHKGKALTSVQGALPKARFLKLLEAHVPALRPPSISVTELDALLKAGGPVHLFDIRDPRDFARSHLRKARCVSVDALETEIAQVPPHEVVALICRTGERSGAEAARLAGRDVRVVALEKGLLEWEGSGRSTYSTREEEELEA